MKLPDIKAIIPTVNRGLVAFILPDLPSEVTLDLSACLCHYYVLCLRMYFCQVEVIHLTLLILAYISAATLGIHIKSQC